MNRLYRHFIVPVRDLLYPPLCCSCESYLEEDESRVCRNCWEGIVRIASDHPAWQHLEQKLRERGAVQHLMTCFLYEEADPLREILHLLKYGGMQSLGIRLGRELGTRVQSSGLSADLLIPVPLHTIVRRERGYNQSESICRGVQQVTGIRVEPAGLLRRRQTVSQTRLSLGERRENVAGAFAVDPRRAGLLHGTRLLLVDDVITTGSTVSACAEALLDSGASEVVAASAAIAR
jgi:ComF family protein